MSSSVKIVELFKIYEEKINILNKMFEKEKAGLKNTEEFKLLVEEYKILNNDYKILIDSFDENDIRAMRAILVSIFEKQNYNIHFHNFLSIDFEETKVMKSYIDISEDRDNLYKNDLFTALKNDREIEAGLRLMKKCVSDSLDFMNLEYLITLYNLLGEKSKTDLENCDKYILMKYNMILLFSSFEEYVIKNNFNDKLPIDRKNKKFINHYYVITRDMYNVAMINEFIYHVNTGDLFNELLVIESLSMNVTNKSRCLMLKEDLDELDRNQHCLNQDIKQKVRKIVVN